LAAHLGLPDHGLSSAQAYFQRYLMYIPEIAHEITSCWISAVPSKMS